MCVCSFICRLDTHAAAVFSLSSRKPSSSEAPLPSGSTESLPDEGGARGRSHADPMDSNCGFRAYRVYRAYGV